MVKTEAKYVVDNVIYLLSQGGNWGLHNIDKALLSYYNLREHRPELLKDMPDQNEVKSKQIVSKEEDKVAEENVEEASEDKDGVSEENGAKNGNDHASPDIKEAAKEAAPEPEPEKAARVTVRGPRTE